MKLRQLNILLILSGIFTFSQISHAQQILKCTDSTGVISYHNDKSSTKGLKCNGTNLATIDKRQSPPKPVYNTSSSSSNSGSLSTEKVTSYEQEIRNQKRLDLLRNELEQERKQLLIVTDMINKTSKSDSTQMKQLEAMKNSHQSNINTLEKELKIDTTDFSKLTSTVIPGLGIIKKNNTEAAKFEIEGVDINKVDVPTSLSQDSIKKGNSTDAQSVNKRNDKSNGLPSLEVMQQQLNNLSHQREGKEPQVDQSQHIQIKRREIPGMKVSQATQNYEPLPTPLSVPDFNIGR